MAVRNLRFEGDESLRKKSRAVEAIDDRVLTLLDDLAETMYKSQNGVGLAAPQIGVLKRVVVIDVDDKLIELINPEIIEQKGEQTRMEGCLSVPGVFGEVKRPAKVVVKALDRHGKEFTVTGEELLAVALCHELDHLDGILFIDKATNIVRDEE